MIGILEPVNGMLIYPIVFVVLEIPFIIICLGVKWKVHIAIENQEIRCALGLLIACTVAISYDSIMQLEVFVENFFTGCQQ